MKQVLFKIKVLAISSMLFGGLSTGGILAYADPPPWAPAHGYHKKKHKKYKEYKKYHYIYYPGHQVYYSPVRRGYYYRQPTGWTFSVNLPSRINLGKGVSIDLGGPTPYNYHPQVIQQYPVIVVDD